MTNFEKLGAKSLETNKDLNRFEEVEHGFNKIYYLDVNTKYEGNADIVILVWNENQILLAEQYRKAHYPDKVVDIAICQNPNVQKEQLGVRDHPL